MGNSTFFHGKQQIPWQTANCVVRRKNLRAGRDYGEIIMAQSHCKTSPISSDECRTTPVSSQLLNQANRLELLVHL